MEKRIDPFTRTPGLAGKAYINNYVADEVIKNFTSDESAKHVYKITGLRGSGKSVEYGRIIRALKETKGWLVYPLSAAGDVVTTLLAKMSKENLIDIKNTSTEISTSATAGADILVASGEGSVKISRTSSSDNRVFSEEALITEMAEAAGKKKLKILIGIDDISKTPETVKLLSMIGSMILSGMQIYLVVTGLSENIEDFSSEANLTFFKRADSIETKELNRYDIVGMYQKLLEIDAPEAKRIEETTKGYAYAYQVLGSLYYSKRGGETLEDLIPEFERIMFRDSYDMIWKSLSEGEKEVIRCISRTKDGKTDEIKALMANPASYPVYRNRLINKHLVSGERRGYLKFRLPHFEDFVNLWGDS